MSLLLSGYWTYLMYKEAKGKRNNDGHLGSWVLVCEKNNDKN